MSEVPFRLGRADGQPVSRAEFVAEARSWLGTKFMHQHADKQAGCDCIGFVRGIAKAAGLVPLEQLATLPQSMFAYLGRPDGVQLREGCDEHLIPIAMTDARPGDVILIRFGRHPQHMALLGDYTHGGLSMIHSLGPGGPGQVVEHRLDDTWRARVVSAYAVPGVEA